MSRRVVACGVSVLLLVSLLVASEAKICSALSHRTSDSESAFMVDTGITLMPAYLSQYSSGAASNGNGWRVMWANGSDYSVNTSGISADGRLLDNGGGAVGHDAYMAGGLTRSIVGTGSGFLAVWTSRNSPSGIWASTLDSVGALIDSLPVFEDSTNQSWPAVAFDGDSTCLVVWTVSRASDRDVFAARITASGHVLDTNPIPIAFDSLRREAYPAVAFGRGVYLVAWAVYDSAWTRPKAKAILVSASGVVLDTAVFLRHDPAATQDGPALAFGDTSFLAAWSEGTGQPDVYAARVSVSGNVMDTAGIQLSSDSTRDVYPSVGFCGTTYLVAWEKRPTSGFHKDSVCGRRMTVDGVPLDSGLIRFGSSGHSCTYPSVAADRSNFLVAFDALDTVTLGDDGCCVRISPDGTVLDSGTFFPLGADAQTGPSGVSDGTDFLAAWTESRVQGSIVQAARIAADGSLLDPIGFTVSDETGTKGNVATGYGDSTYLVAWADYQSARGRDICCARVSVEGQVLDTAGIVVCDESLDRHLPKVSFDGQNFLLVWSDYRSGVNGDIYAARVTHDGVVLDPDGFAVAADTFDDAAPAVCFTGTGYLVVWQEGPQWQGKNNIYGALVSSAGVVTKPRFVVSGATGDQTYPAVACGPTNSLVAWEDTREIVSKIYATRVQIDGTVLDSNGILVGVSVSDLHEPRVMSDEAGFRMLWYWSVPPVVTFGAGRVDTAGNVTHVSDWFGLFGFRVGYDAAYGSGPELLLLYSMWADWESGRFYSHERLWGKLGDVPGIEQADNKQLRRVTGGASIVRGMLLLAEATGLRPQVPILLDAGGRKVLTLRPGANDVRALPPGVYFVREAKAQAQAQAVRKVVVTR
jgi:hypothetical protein